MRRRRHEAGCAPNFGAWRLEQLDGKVKLLNLDSALYTLGTYSRLGSVCSGYAQFPHFSSSPESEMQPGDLEALSFNIQT